MKLDIDADEVGRLDQVLVKAERFPDDVDKIVSRGALNIKNDARKAIGGLAHAPAYPRSIGYDMDKSSREVSAEIGPDKEKRQGSLGNILEYGTVNNPPHPHMGPAALRELPRFEKAMLDAAEEALELR